MTQKRGYSRSFIILQEYEKGHGLPPDKAPNGYVKLEMKNSTCKVSFYVQNLNKNMQEYNMMLISDKRSGNKILNLGELKLDQNGRTDVSMEYHAENIARSGIPMDRIIGASIGFILNGKAYPVMFGFSTKDMPENWSNNQIIENKEIEKPEMQMNQMNQKDEMNQTNQPNQPNQMEQNQGYSPKTQNNIFDEYEQEITNTQKTEEMPDVNNEELRSFRNNKKIKGEYGDFFTNLVEDFEETHDIMPEIKKVKWFKVPSEHLDNIKKSTDYNKYSMIYYPMIANYPYINKYKHYYIGYKLNDNDEVKYIVYGVPGSKSIDEQPYKGKSGHVVWAPMDMDRAGDEDLGCWLMFYDYKSKTIAVPTKS